MEIVRISTAGSVDDGKSTLIGRLLYDNNALTKEQEELVIKKTKEKGLEDLDLSVITDGLVAEREQGITIDVANMYFSTETRKFIITDSPGHVEYTRNMVTGASTAETSIILVDARKGLLEQSFRHFYISTLLKVKRILFCVNKMDLVDFSEERFLEIAAEIQAMVSSSESTIGYEIVPISSLKGDNVVIESASTPWYAGKTVNAYLHESQVAETDKNELRFDVQQVFHTQKEGFTDFRGYAGVINSGAVSVGDRIMTLPSLQEAIVTEIRRYTETLDKAEAGDSVVISLSKEIDISRGSLLVTNPSNLNTSKVLNSTLVWMDEVAAKIGAKYILQVGARESMVKLSQIKHRINPLNHLENEEIDSIATNDIAEVELKLNKPAFLDAYAANKSNGKFILIDPRTNNTVALGFNA